jgi:hypothetical protein
LSQAGTINVAGGGGGGTPVQTLTGNSGGPVSPTANNINILGDDSTVNNTNGITVIGTPGTSTETVTLTNRIQGTVTTVGATTSPIITFTPTVIGTYSFEVRIAAYNTTASLGAAYSIFGSARFDGVNSNLIDIVDKITNEEGAMSAANATFTVSGANILINGVGYAAQTINWGAVGLYTFVGV